MQTAPARVAFQAWRCLRVRLTEFLALSRPTAMMVSPLLQQALATGVPRAWCCLQAWVMACLA